MASLTGKAYYNFVQKPKPAAGKFKAAWSTTLVLDEASKKKAKELKLRIKPATDSIPGEFIKFDSYIDSPDHLKPCTERNGRKPEVRLGMDPYDGPVWQGSEVNAIFGVKEYDGSVKPILRVLQVLKLAEAPEGFDENEGLRVDVENELIKVEAPVAKIELNDDISDL